MIASTQQLAFAMTVGSSLFALGMALTMAVLIVRRRRGERDTMLRQARDVTLSRELLVAISGQEPGALPAFDTAAREDQLRALSHLLQLLRGGDRDRLLALAEAKGLFDAALARLRHGTRARRIDSMRVLEQFASPACVAGLHAALARETDQDVRLEAAATLARMGELPPVDRTISLLQLDSSPRTRLHAALFRSLAQRDGPALTRLASNPARAELRAALVDALGWSGNFAVLPALAEHAHDPDPEVRSAALRAARQLGHPGSGSWALRLLDDPAESVRVQAARTCGALGIREAAPRLRALGEDANWWVRTRAAAALDLLAARPGLAPM